MVLIAIRLKQLDCSKLAGEGQLGMRRGALGWAEYGTGRDGRVLFKITYSRFEDDKSSDFLGSKRQMG